MTTIERLHRYRVVLRRIARVVEEAVFEVEAASLAAAHEIVDEMDDSQFGEFETIDWDVQECDHEITPLPGPMR